MSDFITIKCKKCNNEQHVFSKASTLVKCLICGEELVIPKGGKAELKVEQSE